MNKPSATNVRLQKVIAASGLSSRRAAETLIRQGQVTVNGQVVRTLGTCINPATDHVKVDGRHLESTEPEVFVLFHKPSGCVTTMKDPWGRKTIADLLERVKVRVFPVGRLDFDAEGLLLLTNNGQVAQACLHPRYHVPKTYVLKVSGVLTDEEIKILKEGVALDDGVTSPADVKKSGKTKCNSWLEITIHEGKKHQIKRMVEACGHRVMRIKRVRFGPLYLRDLPLGSFRYASDAEANALREIFCRSMKKITPRFPQSKTYIKHHGKARHTSFFTPQRQSRQRALANDASKSRVAFVKQETGRHDKRVAVSKRPSTTPRSASVQRQRFKGNGTRSVSPSNPFRKMARTRQSRKP